MAVTTARLVNNAQKPVPALASSPAIKSNGVLVSVSPSALVLSGAAAAQSVSAADAVSAYTSASTASRKTMAAFVISDSSSNITRSMDDLETLAKAGKIASISYTDLSDDPTTPPSVTLSAAKLTTNKDVIAKLGSVSKTVSFAGNYGTYKVVAGKTGGVTVTGGTEKSVIVSSANFLKFNDKTVIASSGDANIDALLNIGTPMWWSGSTAASTSAASINPSLNALSSASSRQTLNYSFMDASAIAGLSGTNAAGAAVMTAPEKAAVASAFTYLSSLINVTFTDVTGTANTADISFGQNNQSSSAGYANPPHGNGSNATSYLFLAKNAASNPQDATSNGYLPGTYGWETIIHEIGHTLGLKHPGNYNAGGGGASGPFLPSTTDTRRFSTMSYNDPADSKTVVATGTQSANSFSYSYSQPVVNPSTYGVYDIAALQFLYRANSTTTASTVTATDSYANFQTVWSPNGVKVDASATTNTDIFDMRAGSFSSISIKSKTRQTAAIKAQLVASGFNDTNASAAASAIIKKIVPGPVNPLYSGQNSLALSYGSQFSEVDGGSADDKIYAGKYTATINGGGGNNTVYLAGSLSDWTIAADKSKATLKSDSSVVLTLNNIQTITTYNPATTAMTHIA